MPLTDTAIRVSNSATRPFKIYDREGFFLLINPSHSKLWRWRYRSDGKEKLVALGEYRAFITSVRRLLRGVVGEQSGHDRVVHG